MTDPVTIGALPGDPYLAVDVQPDSANNTFVVDQSELDSYDLLGWGDGVSGWTNVVCDVTGLTLQRGSTEDQGVLTRAEAGECTVTVLDYSRTFDPMANADAVHPGTPLRVRAWGYDQLGVRWDAVLFTGTIRGVPVEYPRTGAPVVRITATDLIGSLARWKGPGRPEPGVGAGDTLLQRVQRVLTETGRDPAAVLAPSAELDTGYAATMAATTIKSAWDAINAATDAELGRVWVNKDNRMVVRSRQSLLAGVLRGTLSDVHGETVAAAPLHCCYRDPAARLATESLTNRAMASRRIPDDGTEPLPESAQAQADDLESQARYDLWVTEQRTLELRTDDQLLPWCQSLILTDSRPRLRVDQVSPAPWTDVDTAVRAWSAVLATDLGDRWVIRYHPERGPLIDRAVGVLGVRLEVNAGEPWDLTWTTIEAPYPGQTNPSGWFVLDLSDLDGEDVLAPYGGPVEPVAA